MGLAWAGVRTVPGVLKEWRCRVTSWMTMDPFSSIVPVRVWGGVADEVGGDWKVRSRFVVVGKGMDFDSRMGSASSSSSSSKDEDESSSRSIRDRPDSFMTMSSLSFSRPASAWVPATA